MQSWLFSLTGWGTEVILWIQGFRTPWLDVLFKALSGLGTTYAYLALLPLVYWCFDRLAGIGLAYVVLLSGWLNAGLKALFAIPRPSDPRIMRLEEIGDPSFPSGHAQNAMAVWGYLAGRARRAGFWVLAVLLILGIGFSRLYLGVHYPQDVLAGYLVGALFLLAFALAEKYLTRLVGPLTVGAQVVLALAVPALLWLGSWALGMPEGQGDVSPAVVAGALFGLNLGIVLEGRLVRFSPAGPALQRAGRFLLGLVLVFAFYLGPRWLAQQILPTAYESAPVRLARYFLVALVVSWIGPWLFVKVGLARRRSR
ncbi:MAG: phosphatase PAP2 family protein [Anaerolineae bacterium]|nr:phosphatase PAP2 family protein [Anaerolineae bacterium]